MSPFAISITMLVIVDAALLYALYAWWRIAGRVAAGREKTSARLFIACFALYVVGQTSVLLWALKVITLPFDISVYLYAVAAILFAVGSAYKLSSLR